MIFGKGYFRSRQELNSLLDFQQIMFHKRKQKTKLNFRLRFFFSFANDVSGGETNLNSPIGSSVNKLSGGKFLNGLSYEFSAEITFQLLVFINFVIASHS